MIHLSACQPQADQFPALSGRHGQRRSYTTQWDTIMAQNKATLFACVRSQETARVDDVSFAAPQWLASGCLESGRVNALIA